MTGLSEGDHNVTATAADAAGNTSQASLDWTVDTTGPDVTATAPTTLTGPFVVDFDEDTSGVDASSVLVTDEAGKSSDDTLACKDESADPTDCANTDVRRVELSPASRLMLGQHYRVQVNPVGSELVMDDLGNVSAAVDDSVRATKSAEESSAGATFAWHTVNDKKAKGGSYVTEHRKGARASWTFSGKAVTWFTITGPTKARLTLRRRRPQDDGQQLREVGEARRCSHGSRVSRRARTRSRCEYSANRAPSTARELSSASTASRWARR